VRVIALTALVGLFPTQTLAVSIDPFQTPTTLTLPPDVPFTAAILPAPDAIGGSRTLLIERLAGTGAATLEVNAGGSGYLALVTDPDTAVDLTVFWGDPLSVYDGLDADLTGGGAADRFRVLTRSSAAVGGEFEVYVPIGTLSQLIFPITSGALGGPFAATDVLFSSFPEIPGAFTEEDFENVGGLALILVVPAGSVLQIDSVETIPEPSLLPALGTASLGLLWLRGVARRREGNAA
jgi:hypothetical protein